MNLKILGAAVGVIVVLGLIYITVPERNSSPPPLPTTPATTAPSITSPPPPTTPCSTTPPSSSPHPSTTAPPSSSPASTHLSGEIDEVVRDGRLYFVVREIMRSDVGGYWIDVYFQNISKEPIVFDPVEIMIINARGTEFTVRYKYSIHKIQGTPIAFPCELSPYESRRVLFEFERSRYVPKKFILTNKYADGTTTWEIDLKQ